MRITAVEAIAIDIPLSKNFGGSTYSVLKRSTLITRLRTSDGLVSEVYNGDNRAHGAQISQLIENDLFNVINGLHIFERERVWDRMFALTHASSDKKLLLEAMACVDCAIWDLTGRALGRSVREIESYRDAGMAGCKFKVGGLSPGEDAARVAVARKAAGDDFILCVDANRGWTAEDAIRFARLVEPHNIRWFEEPCHWYDDAAQMARVRQSTTIPVTAGQCEITSHAIRRLVDARAVDLVNYDASEGGGVTDWLRAASLCRAAGVAMAHHEEAQIASHLLAAVPHGTYAECFADPARDPVWQSMWVNRPPIKDGIMEVSREAGFGIRLDEDMIRRYRTN